MRYLSFVSATPLADLHGRHGSRRGRPAPVRPLQGVGHRAAGDILQDARPHHQKQTGRRCRDAVQVSRNTVHTYNQ